MKFVVYWYALVFFICKVAAFNNIALGRNVTGYHYNPDYTPINSGNLTDGNIMNTCESFEGYRFFISVDLGKTYNIKSSVLKFKGNYSGNTSLQYYDSSHDWPFYVYKTYIRDIPQTIEVDVQRTGRWIYFNFWDHVGETTELELCEIEIYGCETDYFGNDCQPCIKNDNCEVCDVNNGECYVCNTSYTGPNCSMSTDNVVLQKETRLYSYDGYLYGYLYLPSYLLVDGYTTQPSCIDFKSYLNGTTFISYTYFWSWYNIKSVRLYFIYEGDADVYVNYTVGYYTSHSHSGIERIFANTTEVMVPFPHQVYYLLLSFSVVEIAEMNNVPVLLCEIEVNGCPANHYGSPCRPCPVNCDQCNAIDGSCVCQAGYKGDNCTEACSNSTYGVNCVYSCGHCLNETCGHVTGNCLLGCDVGWTTNKCNTACSSGWYGQSCALRCSSHCVTPHLCDRFTGTCLGGCATGWINKTCDSVDTEYCVDWAPWYASVAYHNITWRKEESGYLIRYDPAVTLVCNFSLNSDEDLLYDVTWFIDGLESVNQTVDLSSNYTAVITAHDFLRAQKKIGSNVHCKVGAKRKAEDTPCLFKVGNPFFAGIKIVNPNIELERKGTRNVELEMTIPFATESLYVNGVPQTVSDLNIHMTFKTDDLSKCSGGGSSNQCEVKVKSYSYNDRHKYQNDEWRQNISFPVYSQDTDGYVISSHMTLRLKTGGTNGIGSRIFEHVPLPDISIRVREANEAWKGRSCGVRADPHMYTFDGQSYECQIPGQFINYRNQHQLQWIQSKLHLCIPSYNGPWCVCAVAARAGRDVFVIDLCGRSGVINFELCEDNVLRVTKVHDRHYKVYFPTGTTLSIYIMDWGGHYNIDLEILPSAPDVGNADGLCGYFDGVKDNDFRRRDNNITDDINIRHPNEFSNSWRIQDSENLFTGDSSVFSSLKSISTILVPQCTCTDDGNTECSYSTFTPCSSNRGKQYTCNVHLVKNRRRKRDVSGADLSETRNITFVKTTEYAEAVCMQAFQESSEYSLCQQHVTDLSNVTVSNCIEDIKMTGDDNLTQIHVEAALQQCSAFVLLNATLQESEPEVTYTIESICPNNCSSHGTCEGGNCTCYSGYGGSDCSFDLLGPPTITDVPSAGLCDLSASSCNEATIMGKYFFENMDSNCYISVHQVDVNESTVQEEQMQLPLEERTLFEGYCPLPVNTSGTWTTEIKFNISNDGVRFTETYNVIIYQSQCQEYHNQSGDVFFTVKDAFCYIESACVRPMENSSTNECLICNATNDKYQWTENEDCGQATTESMSTTTLDTTTFPETESKSSTEPFTETTTDSTTEHSTTDKQTISMFLSTQTETSSLTEAMIEQSTMSESTSSRTETETTTEAMPFLSSTTDPIKATSIASESTTSSATTLKATTDYEVSTTNRITTVTTKIASGETTSMSSETQTTSATSKSPETESTSTTSTSPETESTSTTSKSSETETTSTTSKSPETETTSTTRRSTTDSSTTITSPTRERETTTARSTTTESTSTKYTEEPLQSPITNIHLAVGASVSVAGLLALFVIVGMVARYCRKPNKQSQLRQENGEESRNWRDMLVSTPQDAIFPRPYKDSFIPHATSHHFKSLGGSHRNSFDSRLQKW
ncbi:uncharacterized protein LOC125657435 isoform X1 [Ostrea edulis]|uniref:uncharacterized protein LOC125657435 isoform X1 n=1 Tax=Ostrea edulis TaxID=37623 RepID=UPI0024AEAD58|nr:uncharacterized protein LOC125657435 isoform X1 [Ostrea edulis]